MSSKVNVYADEWKSEVVARVNYSVNLDCWDGRNWTNGGVGRHLGLTKLRDGRYVLIFQSEHDGERPYGLIVTPERALNEVLESHNEELLESKRFHGLTEYLEGLEEEDLDD